MVRDKQRALTILATVAFLATAAFATEPPQVRISGALPDEVRAERAAQLSSLDLSRLSTGLLHERTVSLMNLGALDGSADAPSVRAGDWRQACLEVRNSHADPSSVPAPVEVRTRTRAAAQDGVVAVGLLDFRMNRLRDAIPAGGSPAFEEFRVFAASALTGTARAGRVALRLEESLLLSNAGGGAVNYAIDLADGRGFRPIRPGVAVETTYPDPGERTLRLRATRDGETLVSSFPLEIRAAMVLVPDLYWENQTAPYSYAGGTATYDAYVFLGAGHASIEVPLVMVEGFDIDNTMSWPEIVELFDAEGMLTLLLASGFDVVLMNFGDATDYIQRNALGLAGLLERITAEMSVEREIFLGGASLGGLVARYATVWMEDNGLDSNTKMLISVDGPQQGANIPLGLQYWIMFFADWSDVASYYLSLLDRPATRQMLYYHYNQTPNPGVDPLKQDLFAELNAMGNYPSDPRIWKVAIADGSGAGAGASQMGYSSQMSPGSRIIDWEYYNWLVDVIGNVWAVPDYLPQTRIFQGEIDQIWPLPDTSLDVYFTHSKPYDNAPGGWLNMMETAAAETPTADILGSTVTLGDITTNYPNHCFVPTISSLDLQTAGGYPLDLFHDVAGDPDLLSKTPFDAVYFPTTTANEEHGAISTEAGIFLMMQIGYAEQTGAGELPGFSGGVLPRIELIAPNPFRGSTRVSWSAGANASSRLSVHDIAGRRVRVLLDGVAPASGGVEWDGLADDGSRLGPGVYLLRLESGDAVATGRALLLR
ncbi:MAG: hypothetical protein QF819_08060 [Gemmatimonadota bacterium]|jgi:hypothetical protein|nr:hypothetical protein [Gemmatimonadota bacterium]MDP6529583.1 hypothetical protein [Gemmatimonadota bacterium]MDP6803114.1 hypothetical protein [Gemmatimonadota bacterium]